jgi:sulfate transport system ATP-binding protein/sulfonate transport system ATP-binding protein
MGTPAFRLSDVTVTLGSPGNDVLRRVSLEVLQGEILAVVGRSGAGKSTLLNLLAGLLEPVSGSVDWPAHPGVRPRTATVFQDANLFPWLDIVDNVALSHRFGSHPHRLPSRRARRAAALSVLEALDIADLAHRRPHQLSGGQQQRVAIARAVAARPEVLLMDEPFSALDVATRSSLQEWLVGHRRSLAGTAVIVTHDLAEALLVADRIALLTGTEGELRVWTSDVSTRQEAGRSSVRSEIETTLASTTTTEKPDLP